MKDREWLTAAVYDFRERFGLNLLDEDLDFVEAMFLIQVLESSPDSLIGTVKNEAKMAHDPHLIMLGEIFKVLVYSNQKKKKEITLPWEKKQKDIYKEQGKVISQERARKVFSTMKAIPRSVEQTLR